MSQLNVRDFLTRVLPWPSDDEPGYINVHAQLKIDGKTPWTGYPTRDVDSFLQQVHKCLAWRTPPDIYMCLSRQAETKQADATGTYKAAKSHQNALALKALFVDIDLYKPAPHGYSDLTAAVTAVNAFCRRLGIPGPNAAVHSGGGVHVYWISDRQLTAAEWQPYADGLKAAALQDLCCDHGIIADAARVLRVPGTFNFKKTERRPVKLIRLGEKDYDFATDLAPLLAVQPAMPRPAAASLAGRPSSKFAGLPVDSLATGIGHEPLPPLDWQPIVPQCGWFKEALVTGGRDFSQGLWRLTTLATTFLEDGHALAHRMARGYAGYTPDETEAMWERCTNDRVSLGLGWPSCTAIQAEGCKHCASCPILARRKSPLHLGRIPNTHEQASTSGLCVQPSLSSGTTSSVSGNIPGAFQARVTNSNGLKTRTEMLVPLTAGDLPPGYSVDDQGYVCKLVEEKVQGEDAPDQIKKPLFRSRLYGPWAQKGPDALVFIASADKGFHRDVVVPMTEFTLADLKKTLLGSGIALYPENQNYYEDFMNAWITKLHEAAQAQTHVPLGWYMSKDKDEKDVCEGFSYGGVLYKPDGSMSPVGQIDTQMRDTYTPQGDKTKWLALFDTIIEQGRPGLQIMAATAFGAPMMFSAGQYACLLSVWSPGGDNKSTAASCAAAVWGKPILAKDNESATVKSVLHKLGHLNNLPYFWDDVKNLDKVLKVLFPCSLGSDGDRLNPDIKHQPRGTWQTIVTLCTNRSFTSYAAKTDPTTTAHMKRVFEWKEVRPRGARKHLSTDVGRMETDLNRDYGMIGREYASWLGQNYDLCRQMTTEEGRWFETTVEEPGKNHMDERMWIAFCAAIMTGATLANRWLGLKFQLDEMREFLVEKIKEQRKRCVEEHEEPGSPDHTESMLSAFLNDHTRNQLTLAPGAMGQVDVVHAISMSDPVRIEWWMDPVNPVVRLSNDAMKSWCNRETRNYDLKMFTDALRHHYGATPSRLTMGARTVHKGIREYVWIIPLNKNPTLTPPGDEDGHEATSGGSGSGSVEPKPPGQDDVPNVFERDKEYAPGEAFGVGVPAADIPAWKT